MNGAPLRSAEATVDVAVPARAAVGEGPYWNDGTLLWTDLPRGTLFRSDLAAGETRSTQVRPVLGAVVPTASGVEVAITDRGFERLDEHGTTLLAEASSGEDQRMNDGKCDRAGRFWAGQTTYDFEPGGSSLCSWDPQLGLRTHDTGLTLPNGSGWSLDNRWMYLVDSVERCVYRYDFDVDDGVVDDRQLLSGFEPKDGLPDGLAVDEDGCLWVAFYGGGCLRRLDPSGRIVLTVGLPVSQPTSCCFGADDALYVTTASAGLDERGRSLEPLAGSVLRLDVGVRGAPVHKCAEPVEAVR